MAERAFVDDFKAALHAGVPLVTVQSADPASVIKQVLQIVSQESSAFHNFPLIAWDVASGLKSWNKPGGEAVGKLVGSAKPESVTDPKTTLRLLASLEKKSIVFIHNGHRLLGNRTLEEATVGQAIWNLRDQFKNTRRMLVILAPFIQLPEELKQDVLILDEPLPTQEELKNVVIELYDAASIKQPEPQILTKSVEAIKGLSMFAAEQAVAMSLTKAGINLDRLWHRKKKAVEQTPGLSIYDGKETFADVEGVESIKHYLTRLFKGEEPPTVIVFMDEIEKMFAGIQGDMSGTSTEQLGEFLRWTQDKGVLGTVWVGHPGCSKSLTAKACGRQFEIPVVELNMTALKGGIVGQTGAQTRAAFKTISGIGRPLIIATSNALGILPPELKRRFKQGTWFFDLPTAQERKAVWNLYIKKYKLTNVEIPDDKDWTQDEIETCCKTAWRLKCTLKAAAGYIVNLINSDPEKITNLRMQANNRFLSASMNGVYRFDQAARNASLILNTVKTNTVGEA